MTETNPDLDVDESDLFPDDAVPSTPVGTRDEYLRRGRSGYTKIRHALIQTAPTSEHAGSKPGLLPIFARNHRAAVLYLAVLTNWTWLRRSGDTLPADTWIRFLSSDKKGALTWTPQSLSHAWSVLEDGLLVHRELDHRMKRVTPLHESGSGKPYGRVDGIGDGVYFTLPHEFWSRELHATLSWPALAALLILLKESGARVAAELAVDRAQKHYGISRTTAEEGLTELRDEGLLISRQRWVQDHDAGEGRRWTSLHVLTGEFSTKRREALRNAARDRRTEKKAGSKGTKSPGKKAKSKRTNAKKAKRTGVGGDETSKSKS